VNRKPCSEKVLSELSICDNCDRKEKCKNYKYVVAAKIAMERKKRKKYLSEICKEIGCSSEDNECPGNEKCRILKKIRIINHGFIKK
jgi:predicted ATP-grasp superfamily ATP-dependent carboligase